MSSKDQIISANQASRPKQTQGRISLTRCGAWLISGVQWKSPVGLQCANLCDEDTPLSSTDFTTNKQSPSLIRHVFVFTSTVSIRHHRTTRTTEEEETATSRHTAPTTATCIPQREIGCRKSLQTSLVLCDRSRDWLINLTPFLLLLLLLLLPSMCPPTLPPPPHPLTAGMLNLSSHISSRWC